jgi:hypothetical protein
VNITLILSWSCKKKKDTTWSCCCFFFFCRVIDAFVEADRKGYKIRVSNDKVYVKHPDAVYYD